MTNTIQLSETQRQILTAACERRGGCVLPLTADLKGGAVPIVLKSLLSKGLIAEAPAKGSEPVWRTSDKCVPLVLKATRAAYQALGIEKPKSSCCVDESAPSEVRAKARRADTKQALLIGMLQRPEGATVAEVVAATGWQPHTVRGAISGALKKRLGLTVTSEEDEERGRVYRVGR